MEKLFTRITDRYDTMNHIMSLGLDLVWRKRALQEIKLRPAPNILDLACGTGDFTHALAQRWRDAKIIGIDITPSMLAAARQKIASPRVSFRTGDAHTLSDIPDRHFDLVVCAFGFRNFPDKARALAACRRVLADGGRLVVLELFRPRYALLGRLVSLWFVCTAWLFVRKEREAYRYLRTSVEHTVSPEAFAALATATGFRKSRARFFFPAATCMVFEKREGQ